MKFVTKHTCGLVVLRTNNFFSPFSPFFCSSNLRRMQPTLSGSARAAVRVRVWFPAVVHWTSSSVKAYALLNRFLWWDVIFWCLESVCIHSTPRHPAYRLQIVQFAMAASIQQSSFWVAALFAMNLCMSSVKGSLRLGTDSHRFTSSIILAIGGASLVSAAERNLGSISRNRPRNFATSSR